MHTHQSSSANRSMASKREGEYATGGVNGNESRRGRARNSGKKYMEKPKNLQVLKGGKTGSLVPSKIKTSTSRRHKIYIEMERKR